MNNVLSSIRSVHPSELLSSIGGVDVTESQSDQYALKGGDASVHNLYSNHVVQNNDHFEINYRIDETTY